MPRLDEYVATVKSRRSASIQPQVDGSLTRILVKSGDHVRAGQAVMTIDPLKQQATVDQQRSTEAQKKATLDYNQNEVERQHQAIRSRREPASRTMSWRSRPTKIPRRIGSRRQPLASPSSASSATTTSPRPFAGVVGDIPVHIGDYVSPQTLLTTVDENADLEAYIYIPTERSADIHMGLPVQIVTSSGELIEGTKIYFISQQVDNALQGILVKAPSIAHSTNSGLRSW